MELYASCSGDWKTVIVNDGITPEECAAFLEFAATFLSNVGNYYVCLPCRIHATYIHAEF
jgi:dipeptidyl-peptidase-3